VVFYFSTFAPMQNAEWFIDWFNSPYYHLLYNNRNFDEARQFVDTLCRSLALPAGSNVWDLACGKGRHSLALNQNGYNVTGTDLSPNSIHEAQKNESSTLHFQVHDMRTPFRQNHFDAVFNLFTSIGYFTNMADNHLVFKHVAEALKPGGLFVIDFFNATKVAAALKPLYIEERGEITFTINKVIENNFIHKTIRFSDKGQNYFFTESVSLLGKDQFCAFAADAGLQLAKMYGNYQLGHFDEAQSDRLILIFKKNS